MALYHLIYTLMAFHNRRKMDKLFSLYVDRSKPDKRVGAAFIIVSFKITLKFYLLRLLDSQVPLSTRGNV